MTLSVKLYSRSHGEIQNVTRDQTLSPTFTGSSCLKKDTGVKGTVHLSEERCSSRRKDVTAKTYGCEKKYTAIEEKINMCQRRHSCQKKDKPAAFRHSKEKRLLAARRTTLSPFASSTVPGWVLLFFCFLFFGTLTDLHVQSVPSMTPFK